MEGDGRSREVTGGEIGVKKAQFWLGADLAGDDLAGDDLVRG